MLLDDGQIETIRAAIRRAGLDPDAVELAQQGYGRATLTHRDASFQMSLPSNWEPGVGRESWVLQWIVGGGSGARDHCDDFADVATRVYEWAAQIRRADPDAAAPPLSAAPSAPGGEGGPGIPKPVDLGVFLTLWAMLAAFAVLVVGTYWATVPLTLSLTAVLEVTVLRRRRFVLSARAWWVIAGVALLAAVIGFAVEAKHDRAKMPRPPPNAVATVRGGRGGRTEAHAVVRTRLLALSQWTIGRSGRTAPAPHGQG